MKNIIIKRLFDSFAELERAISTAKVVLSRKEVPPVDILDRIRSYEEILEKQRSLAASLCGYLTLGNWDEVARHVKIINGLSAMIRDDARDVAKSLHARSNLSSEDRMPLVI